MNRQHPDPFGPATLVGRFLLGLFGLVFGGTGLTVIGFLWGAPWDDFGSPPLFFRLVGSFIALAFVGFGGAMLVGAFTGGNALSALQSLKNGSLPSSNSTTSNDIDANFTCPQCSAPLRNQSQVSPHGDVQCSFCNCWFNIHKKP